MATIDYNKKVFTTPVGECEPYAYIRQPDFGSENFKNPRGVYKVDLTLQKDNPSCIKMMDAIVACHEENYAAKVAEFEENPPKVARGKKPLQPYEGDMPFIDNEDGTVTFKFKAYGSYTDKKTGENREIKLLVVDSKGKKLEPVPIIAQGSKLKIKFKMIPYSWNPTVGASVKLQLESVMVVELAEFGGGSDLWGDDDYEDGFSADENPAAKAKGGHNDDTDGQSWDDSEGDDDTGSDDGDF